jgi:cytochrome c553
LTGQPASTVAWTVATRQLLTQGDPARGAALATICNDCHGTNGVSNDAAIPNLAGQSVAAVYNQLVDFKEGRRSAAVMGVYVDQLSQATMANHAAYYASMPNPFTGAPTTSGSSIQCG